ncbi:MAG: hypothetical protein WCQ21_35415 [Verrucomicrobiota bacterium]|jgi:hypothetical protein
MKLIEIIRNLDTIDTGQTIYAAEPWTPSSEAIPVREPEAGNLPAEAQRLGLRYFLEVSVARDFLDGWVSNLGAHSTDEQKCARLIQYAVNDA